MRTLENVKDGETCRVLSIAGERPIKRRIMDMGITKGVEVRLVKRAPLGDPIELNVRGYQLSVRMEDARNICIE